MDNYNINYKEKNIKIEKLPNGKFKIPDFVEELSGSFVGFNPKPAYEVVLVAMKPFNEKSYIDQALKHLESPECEGLAGSWLDSCRIPYKNDSDFSFSHRENALNHVRSVDNSVTGIMPSNKVKSKSLKGNINDGRFPGNLLCSDDVLNDGVNRKGSYRPNGCNRTKKDHIFSSLVDNKPQHYGHNDSGSFSRYFSLDSWHDKFLKELPESVQRTYPFILVPKASKSEKNRGCEELDKKDKPTLNEYKNPSIGRTAPKNGSPQRNNHPTVKPLKLFSYLITLFSRPNQTVLDPYAGSGTTCISAKMLNRRSIGFELEPEYKVIADARLQAHEPEPQSTLELI